MKRSLFFRITRRNARFARWLGLAALAGTLLVSTGCSKKTPEEKMREIAKYIQNGDNFSAIIKSKDFLKEYPDTPESYQVREILARCYYQERDFEQTRKYLDEIYEKYGFEDRRGFAAFIGRVGTYMSEGKTTTALEIATEKLQSIDTSTTKTVPYNLLRKTTADYQIMAGHLAKGQEMLREMLEEESDPNNAMGLTLGLASSSIRYGEPKDAVAAFKGFFERFPNVEDRIAEPQLIQFIEDIVGMFAQKQDFDSAIELYQFYLDRNPDSEMKMKLLTGIGFYLKAAGRDDEAARKFETALAGVDERIAQAKGAAEKGRLTLEKSKVLELSGESDKAIELCREYMREYPSSELAPHFLNNMIMIYRQRNDIDGAIQVAREMEEKFPDQPVAQIARQAAEQLTRAKEQMAVQLQQMEARRQQQAPGAPGAPTAPTTGSRTGDEEPAE